MARGKRPKGAKRAAKQVAALERRIAELEAREPRLVGECVKAVVHVLEEYLPDEPTRV